jgi:hypothetical protein
MFNKYGTPIKGRKENCNLEENHKTGNARML